MKRCPTCNQTFTESHLSFCIDDGTPLVPVDEAPDSAAADANADEATMVRSSAGPDSGSSGSSDSYGRGSGPSAYQPPGSYLPPSTPPGYNPQQGKRQAWPWLVGLVVLVLVVFAGLGIAAVLLIPRSMLRGSTNANNSNVYVVPNNANSNSANSNANSSDWNENLNSNSTGNDTTPAPTDEAAVLSELRDLEHEWTVANINADKKKLNRILADDYVGILPNGKPQGKAEYLRTARRDDATQKWEFADLKLSLRGDRATLTGVLQLEIKDEQGEFQNVAFRFTDKFVWRDGRWQATASEVAPVKQEGTAA